MNLGQRDVKMSVSASSPMAALCGPRYGKCTEGAGFAPQQKLLVEKMKIRGETACWDAIADARLWQSGDSLAFATGD